MSITQVNYSRLRQLAQNAGVQLVDLPPKFSLLRQPPPEITEADATLANALVAEEAMKIKKSRVSIKGRKSHVKNAVISALSRVVQENGSVGVARRLLQLGGFEDFKVADRQEQTPWLKDLLRNTVDRGNIELAGLLSLFAAPEQLVNAMSLAIAKRDSRLIQILFETGADPNQFDYVFREAAATDETLLLRLFLQAPIRVSPALLNEARIAAIGTGCVASTALLIQSDCSNFSDRSSCLRKVFQTTRLDLFITIIYFTGAMQPHTLAGLMDFITREVHNESPATNAMIEALLCAGANSLIQEATTALLTCVRRRMTGLVRLLIAYRVPVSVMAAQEAIYAAEDELVDLIFTNSGAEPEFAGRCVVALPLPPSVPESHRQKLLQKLLSAGASGNFLNDELIRAVSFRQREIVSDLLHHGASPSWNGGRALVVALDTKQIPIFQQLLKSEIQQDVRDRLFLRLSQLDRLPKILMTKLFLAGRIGVDVLSQALLETIRHDPAKPDEELVELLINAGARCDWNGGESLQTLISNRQVRLFRLVLYRFGRGPVGDHLCLQLPPDIFSAVFKTSLNVSEPLVRTAFLKELIIACDLDEFAKAFDAFLRSETIELDLIDLFLEKHSLDLNSEYGKAILDAALVCNQAVLERILRTSGISPATIQFLATRLIEDVAIDEKERAMKLSLLFHGRKHEDIATQTLKQLLTCCISGGKAELDWHVPSISSLLAVGADVNAESGSFLIAAVTTYSQQALALFLSQNVQEQCLDFALRQASQLEEEDQQLRFCEMILAANPSRNGASEVLTDKAKGGNIQLCTILLDFGAYPNHLCFTNSLLGSHLELLKLLLARTARKPSLLSALWIQIGNISSSEPRSLALCEILLKAGFTGQAVAETLLHATRSQDVELCRMLLKYEMACLKEPHTVSSTIRDFSIQFFPSTSWQQPTVLDEGLLWAVDAVHEDLVNLLIAHGASAQSMNGEAIWKAISKGSTSILDLLLNTLSEPEVSIATEAGIKLAADLRFPHVCLSLLKRLPEEEFKDEETMIIVTSKGDLELLQVFLEAKPTQDTLEASLTACQGLEEPIKTRAIKAIFDSGFTGRSLDTYLLTEVQSSECSVSAVQLLIQHGASPDHENCQSILTATRARHSEILKILLHASSRDDVVNKCLLETVNSECLDSSTLEIIQLLGNKGVSEDSLTLALKTMVENYLYDDCRTEIIHLLVELGADVNHEDGTILCCASGKGSQNLLRALVMGNPSKEARIVAIKTLLQSKAIDNVLIESLEVLILEPDGNLPYVDNDEYGQSALEMLLLSRPNSHRLISRFFRSRLALNHSSDISIVNWVLSQQNPRISDACIRILIENIGQRAHLAEVTGVSLVMTAVENQRHDIIEDLAARGATLGVVGDNSESPLSVASRNGYVRAVRSLTALGAAQDDGSLHEAAMGLHADVAEVLIDAGHDVNNPSSSHGGRSVLAHLCLLCSPLAIPGDEDVDRLRPTIRLLLNRGANLSMEWEGKNSLFLALDNPNPIMADVLITTVFQSPSTGQQDMLRSSRYFNGGFCYSPITYLTKSNPPPNSWESQTSRTVIEVLRTCEVPDVYYATEGSQPDDAVGVPDEIVAAEQGCQELLRLSRDCEVCRERPTGLEDCLGSITSDCTHEWENIICRSCLQEYVASKTAKTDGLVPQSIPCWVHGCNAVLKHSDVQKAASCDIFAEYDSALVRQAIHAGENYIECAHSGCEGGGWYEPDAVSYIYCGACVESTCIACNTPGHKDTLCPNSEEAKRLRREEQQQREEDDLATEALVGQISKPCPGTRCGVSIQKNEGCDHMTCRRCRYEFCWLCLADYKEILRTGNAAHVTTCTYFRSSGYASSVNCCYGWRA